MRSADQEVQALIHHGIVESPYFRSLVARLEATDVIVYVNRDANLPALVEGHMRFLGAAGGRRYVVVSLAFGRSELRTVATLGHELQHALEVAEHPDIVDAESMRHAYATFGDVTGTIGASDAYDTQAAIHAGQRIWYEVSNRVARQPDSSYGLTVAP